MNLISDAKLKERVSVFSTVANILGHLDPQYGNPELAAPQIVNKMRKLRTEPTSYGSETNNIVSLLGFYAQLQELKSEQLLNKQVVFELTHALAPVTGKALMDEICHLKNPELRMKFIEVLNRKFISNSNWERTGPQKEVQRPKGPSTDKNERGGLIRRAEIENDPRQKHESKRPPQKNQKKFGSSKPLTYPCGLCNQLDHPTYRCPKLAKTSLQQVIAAGLCTACLRKEHHSGFICDGKARGPKGVKTVSCFDCGYHLYLEIHQGCSRNNLDNHGSNRPAHPRQAGQTNRFTRPAGPTGPPIAPRQAVPPPVDRVATPRVNAPVAARSNRSKVDCHVNALFPNLLNGQQTSKSAELVDEAMLID